jgi:NAD(P)-dependent dehydrogenase (short-subunit alcohol dehydrogenase family)
VQCDVEHRDQIEAAVAQVIAQWGRLDLLVNNAHNKVYQSIRKLTDATKG